MKAKKYGCYCYNIHKGNLAKPNQLPCTNCIQLGSSHPCHHQAISDEQLIEGFREEYN
jgi:hypothetical protein